MWRAFAITALVAVGSSGKAGAQCLTIPTGSGDAAIHCPDGRVGHVTLEPGGAAASGMLAGQVFVAPPEAITAPGLSSGVAAGPLASELTFPTRPLAPPSIKPPSTPKPAKAAADKPAPAPKG